MINALIIVTLAASQAHAYIDPGNGSMFIQTALLMIFGFGIAIRKFIFRLFRSLEKPQREEDSASALGD